MSIRLYSLQCYMKLAVTSPSFPQVEELELSADALTQSSIPQLAPVFANIASLFPPDTLTKITIRDYSSYAHLAISQDVAITPQILRHLFIFRNLRQLRIAAWSWRTEYGDNLLVDMAAAWPNLRHLDLNTSVEASGWEKSRFLVTLRGMLTLAWRCRELNYLGVLFHADPSSFPDHEELLEQDLRVVDGSPVLASLRRLNVSWSTITNPEQVAAIVSKFFLPSMTVDSACGRWSNGDFESDTGTESSENEAWGSVAGLLPVLCGVREEERKRARRLVASGRFSAI
ncbi:hypothetical protein EVJ58_g8211 [Rhodofomes roseus]|uniref:Uncharacterized protein n=1 Tax=Rhodofomes roseus TaxID=34475 RepID=A0A4Y9Y0D6_9APHY|nr:hypothetical protein EVJ58_g8211 [Rhodofomes roseus]